ncbi:Uncharacterised protein [Yersinia thracica]|uniref:Tox-PL domain-containing protein n=1 Tax=Yersinia thracica TaxID=2890319 RepID=A0A0T9PZ29_9GAMM|nr:hypothetical protein [Yersinia thracica]CNH88758.1 Uncharacterised protein [Yersinia thracica]
MNINGASNTGWSSDGTQDLQPEPRPLKNVSTSSAHSIDEDFNCFEEGCLESTPTYTAPIIENRKDPEGIKPDDYRAGKDAYLGAVLLKEINRDGKAPLWLRPLAALLSFFGIQGFGQTNCVSCATAVVDTLTDNSLYRALPELRGARVAGNMLTLLQSGLSAQVFADHLSGYKKDNELFAVIAINRPALRSWLPGAIDGHACNLIKFKDSNIIHLFDAQKMKHFSCELSEIAGSHAEILDFLGSIEENGINLWEDRARNS